MQNSLFNYLLYLGDNSMILGHRLSELCGHGPNLETDIALTNISLDLLGQVRSYFQYAAKIKGDNATEDSIACLRNEREYLNVTLVEQKNTDFAYVIARQFYFDAYHYPLLSQLQNSKDEMISAIASKSIKEVKYHLRFSGDWIKRLGDGTEESHNKMQVAVDELYPYTGEFFKASDYEIEMAESGIGANIDLIKDEFNNSLKETFSLAGLIFPNAKATTLNGKNGYHSEKLGFILAELQYMQRAYPNMKW